MIVIENFTQLAKWKNTRFVCTIGNFDGLHSAHKKIVHDLKRIAKREKALSMIITFKNHPMQVGKQKKKPILTSLDHKITLFEKEGIDCCFVLSLTKALKNMNPEEFLEKVLFRHFPIAYLIIGYNFCFGRKRVGDAKLIYDYAVCHGVQCKVERPIRISKSNLSSSRVRRLISLGRLKQAEKILGRKYSVFASVVSGAGRGTALGFPTANLDVHSEIFPPSGVYLIALEIRL